MDHSITMFEELLQGGVVGEVSLYKGNTEVGKVPRFGGISDQCADLIAPLQQALAQDGTDKTGSAGNGNGAAVDNQAEATLKRTSSAAASSISRSLPLIKSRRALARDNLPEEVRGSE